jgi:uncharacterized protein GlcG (DUF336 family)/quercetin dioxygenase-like cupin family protein
MIMLTTLGVAALAVATSAPPVQSSPSLTLDGARLALRGAVEAAHSLQTTGVIAVVDAGGHTIALERLDGTFPAGSDISIGKARTAALFRKPTSTFEKIIRDGRTPMIALDGFTPLQGGVPLVVDGTVVGAIGVSGAASAQQDEELANAGAQHFAKGEVSTSASAIHIDATAVDAAFAKGMPLLENGDYKIHASRREGPGKAEVHDHETDVIHVLEGSATFVTGGRIVEGAEITPGETRGAGIEGGDARTIGKGDVVVVPAGTPHWFREVQGPLLYFVVKVIGSEDAS